MIFREDTRVRCSTRKENWLQGAEIVLTDEAVIVEIPLKPFHLGLKLFDLDPVLLVFRTNLTQHVEV